MKDIRQIQIPEGELTICGKTNPEDIERMDIDLQLKAFRPAKRQKQALMEIAGMDNGKVVIAHISGIIVGYVTFHPPDEFERWSAGPRQVLELGAIEVTPKLRKYGIGRNMLEMAFQDPGMEDFVVLSTEYYWHWDLEGTGMHVWQYREIMRKLMEYVGLNIVDTDEEEITSHAANMLMVRYGKNLDQQTIKAFNQLLFFD